jgi:SAM-dependent methyltransferase
LLTHIGFVDIQRYTAINAWLPLDRTGGALRDLALLGARDRNDLTARKPASVKPFDGPDARTQAHVTLRSGVIDPATRVAHLQLDILNDGYTRWPALHFAPGGVTIGLRRGRPGDDGFIEAAHRQPIPYAVEPGEVLSTSARFVIPTDAPLDAWTVDLVSEQHFWFSERGPSPDPIPVGPPSEVSTTAPDDGVQPTVVSSPDGSAAAGFGQRLTRNDVVAAYRFLLGRAPESEHVISEHMRAGTIATLRETILQGAEFQHQLVKVAAAPIEIGRHVLSPAMSVDLRASADALDEQFARISHGWETLGSADPRWSVLSYERFREPLDAGTEDEFYATGAREARLIRAFFERAKMEFPNGAVCLDFGCGVGRVALHVAGLMRAVIGADVSKAHLALAKQRAESQAVTNVRWLHLPTRDSLASLPASDLVVSFLVLQHSPPPLMQHCLRAMLEAVKPGGFSLFQVPTYRLGYTYPSADATTPFDLMEIHAIPGSRVFAALSDLCFDLLEVQEDRDVRDPDFISQTFFVKRRTVVDGS